MNFRTGKMPLLAVGMVMSAVAFSQSRGAFNATDSISGFSVTISNGALTYDVLLGANPTFTVGGNTYHITSVIGVYVLSDDDDLNATNSNFGVWSANNSNAGSGGVAGWKSNPNNGFLPGQSQAFTFSALNFASVERMGYDVVTSELFPGTTGNTGHIAAPVPEPASFLGLGLGALAILGLRRKK